MALASGLLTWTALIPRRFAEPKSFEIGVEHSWSWAIGFTPMLAYFMVCWHICISGQLLWP